MRGYNYGNVEPVAWLPQTQRSKYCYIHKGDFKRGCFPYENNASPAKYILSFGSVGHILSRTKKAIPCLPVTYAAKPEKQISITNIDTGLSKYALYSMVSVHLAEKKAVKQKTPC